MMATSSSAVWLVCPFLEECKHVRTADVPFNTTVYVEFMGAKTFVDPSRSIHPICDITSDGLLRQGFEARLDGGIHLVACMMFRSNRDVLRSRHAWLPCKMNVIMSRADGNVPNEDDMRFAMAVCSHVRNYTDGENPHGERVTVKWEFRQLLAKNMIMRMAASCVPNHKFTRTFGLLELNRLVRIASAFMPTHLPRAWCGMCKNALCDPCMSMCGRCCTAFRDVNFDVLEKTLNVIKPWCTTCKVARCDPGMSVCGSCIGAAFQDVDFGALKEVLSSVGAVGVRL